MQMRSMAAHPGAVVSWLHVRLDDLPQHYAYGRYRVPADNPTIVEVGKLPRFLGGVSHAAHPNHPDVGHSSARAYFVRRRGGTSARR